MTRAAEAFDEMLRELGIDEAETDQERLGRRAALLAASDFLWQRELGLSFGSKQVGDLFGCSRQAVNDRVQRGNLLGLPSGEGLRFPAFQFTRAGKPLPGLRAIVQVLRDVAETPYTIGAWFVTPEPLLEGKTPAEWLRAGRSSALAAQAAARYAERLAH